MSEAKIQSLAEDCLEMAVSDTDVAHRLADRLRSGAAFEEVVPGLQSIAVRYNPSRLDRAAVVAQMEAAMQQLARDGASVALDEVSIPVRYGGDDGPDLAAVCERTGLTADAVIEQHSQSMYRVDLLGFTPGFAYLSGLPASLNVPRLDVPRVRLPAGSVGITNGYTGLYAMAGPGGWAIIGRTDAVLFEPSADDPFRIKPGAKIRFVPQ